MPAVRVDDESCFDQDDLKMPESPEHRRVTELIAILAEQLLPALTVCRDMNCYPLDGGSAIAPDVMTLPAGTIGRSDKSYRQADGGPSPGVAIEVASESDSFPGLNAKRYRYSRLGVPAYIVTVDLGALDVIRCDDDLERWVDAAHEHHGVAVAGLGE